jgi:tRNA 5-methylaminomethyl-2-thiouridine biosynthesis bifunctional protein
MNSSLRSALLAPQPSAALRWQNDGAPYRDEFADGYFSAENGLAETKYIFLAGNHLPERWRHRPFTIAELGFGTGLNLACVLQARQRAREDNLPWLSFWTVDNRPLLPDDLQRAHQQWPALRQAWDAIESAYPPLWHGWHCRLLKHYRVQWTCVWDEAEQALEQAQLHADAWFLDGFKPKTNDSMWSEDILRRITEQSRAGATLSTYTAAGAVRRGLQKAGWQITKRAGYGCKRDSIQGTLREPAPPSARSLNTLPQPAVSKLTSTLPIAVVGGGMAGCCVAHRLQQCDRAVTIFDRRPEPAQAASGNYSGWLHPLLRDPQAVQGAWYDAAWAEATAWPLVVRARGGFWSAPDAATAKKWSQRGIAPEIAEFIASSDATGQNPQHARWGGWNLPGALTIDPVATCHNLVRHCTWQGEHGIHGYLSAAPDRHWLIDHHGNRHGPFAAIVWCTAGGADAMDPQADDFRQAFPYRFAKGHVGLFAGSRQTAWAGTRYFLPHSEGIVVGTDYQARARDAVVDQEVLQGWKAETLVADQVQKPPKLLAARAAIRCTTPDHLPLVGPVIQRQQATEALAEWSKGTVLHDKLPAHAGHWVSMAHGSRGLSGACYAARILVAQMLGLACPVPRQDTLAIQPDRAWLRELRRA